jgi:uncharacterized C2H2 Zn-finger protein
LETAVVHSQVTTVTDTLSTPGVEELIVETKRVSVAWLCFDREKAYQRHGIDYVKCNQPRCGTEFKLNSTTSSNLSRHVQKKHPQLLPQKKTSMNAMKQTTLSFSKQNSIIPPFSDENFQQYLTNLFVVQDLPFLLLESSEFRDLLLLMRPGTRIIKADALKNRIMDYFKKTKAQMTVFFSSIDSRISFTTDVWTSPNDLAFMAITAHWISADFHIHSLLIDFVELFGSHSGVNIEKAFSQSLIECNVFDKKLAITLDNAYNNDTFISALMERDPSFDKEHHIRCFGHILNLCAQDALALVKDELSGIRDYIKAIIHRPKRLQQLKDDFEESGGKDFVKPMLDVKTRWNSTADMIIRAFRLRDGLSITMESLFHEANAKKRRKVKGKGRSVIVAEMEEEESFVQITEEHWKNLSDILHVLEPLKKATELLSGDSYPSLNMVVPCYVMLMNHLERLSSCNDVGRSIYTESDFKVDASKAALMKLNTYYDVSSELCTIATVLDPRHKLDFYKSDQKTSADNPEEIRSYVKSFYNRDYASGTSSNPSPEKPSLLAELFKQSTTHYTEQSEFDVYLSEPVARHHSKFNVLDYWKINSDRFPNLSRMARDYLAVPGTSTPSERAFSGGRQLITDFRCRLKGETITACMLLKSWRRQWDGLIQPKLDYIHQ